MAWWSRLLPARKMSTLELFREVFGSRASTAGKTVTVNTALQVATALACVRVLANGVAQVPLKLFVESDDGRRRKPAKDHPLYDVLHRRPNPWQTSFQYRQTLMLHVALCGGHYSFINRVRGRIVELIPFIPGAVTVKRAEDCSLTYVVRGANGDEQTFQAESIWHVRGLSWDSWRGLEVITMAREALGLSMALEGFQSDFHAKGARPMGVLSVDGKLSDEQYKKLRKWLEAEHGKNDPTQPMILDNAAKWISQTMTGVDAQTLESRKLQIEEVCRAFGVMPIMIGYSDKAATYASAEQMFLAHVVHTLSPWYEMLEQDIDVRLLSDTDRRQGVYAKFVAQGLLRGALKDTADYLVKLTGGGIMTRNEAREKIELDAIEGLDEPLTPAGTAKPEPVEELPADPPAAAA